MRNFIATALMLLSTCSWGYGHTSRLGSLDVPAVGSLNWGNDMNANLYKISSFTASTIDFSVFKTSTEFDGPVLISSQDANGNSIVFSSSVVLGGCLKTTPTGGCVSFGGGTPGAAATIDGVSAVSVSSTSSASATNIQTSSAAYFDFNIPRGADGAVGPQGSAGTNGTNGINSINYVSNSTSSVGWFIDTFSCDGNTTIYTLTYTPSSAMGIDVRVSGSVLTQGNGLDYTYTFPKTITLSTPIAASCATSSFYAKYTVNASTFGLGVLVDSAAYANNAGSAVNITGTLAVGQLGSGTIPNDTSGNSAWAPSCGLAGGASSSTTAGYANTSAYSAGAGSATTAGFSNSSSYAYGASSAATANWVGTSAYAVGCGTAAATQSVINTMTSQVTHTASVTISGVTATYALQTSTGINVVAGGLYYNGTRGTTLSPSASQTICNQTCTGGICTGGAVCSASSGASFTGWVKDYFSGNGSTKVFSLSQTAISAAAIDVDLNGFSVFVSTDFTATTSAVTFSTAPASGALIQTHYMY